jgi:hypothetical protein
MTDKQSEAQRLAKLLDKRISMWDCEAAAELRRLDALNAELVEALRPIAEEGAISAKIIAAAKAALAKAEGK